ncbi:hypothetical protein ZHAS_00019481 [Anopheles sinensis]|uniref:Uncharacterized protein n=1 Tax=Anopheles sinensis TaxID=74873 RepID=A0A084WLX2_ANOSI|nr:hypothetical protein ZHAS_00019481 [Anopheles sinensis]
MLAVEKIKTTPAEVVGQKEHSTRVASSALLGGWTGNCERPLSVVYRRCKGVPGSRSPSKMPKGQRAFEWAEICINGTPLH